MSSLIEKVSVREDRFHRKTAFLNGPICRPKTLQLNSLYSSYCLATGDRTISNLWIYAKDDMRSLFSVQWKGIQSSFMWVLGLILEKNSRKSLSL